MGLGKAVSDLSRFFAAHPLTRDDRTGAWRRFALWQVRSRLAGDCEVQWVCGLKMMIRRGMTGATGNIYAGLHEFTDMMLLLHLLRRGDVFLDIGANIGSYTLLAAGAAGATTLAFEPDPGTAQSLRRNIALNRLEDRVTVHETALGEGDGTVRFSCGLDTVNHVVTGEGNGTFREVPVRRLDALMDGRQPLMMKIDVEGYEEPVLRGAASVLGGESLKVIVIETLTPEIERTFAAHRFERVYYDPFGRVLGTAPNGLPANNALYVRDRPMLEQRIRDANPVRIFGRSI